MAAPLSQELASLDVSYPTEEEIVGARAVVIDRYIANGATPRG